MLDLYLKFWIPLNSGLRVRQSMHSSYQLDSSQTVAVTQCSFSLSPCFSASLCTKAFKTATFAATEAFECLLNLPTWSKTISALVWKVIVMRRSINEFIQAHKTFLTSLLTALVSSLFPYLHSGLQAKAQTAIIELKSNKSIAVHNSLLLKTCMKVNNTEEQLKGMLTYKPLIS